MIIINIKYNRKEPQGSFYYIFMKTLTKYLIESIFDEDTHMSDLEDIAICTKWVNEFASTSDFNKTMQSFLDELEQENDAKLIKRAKPNEYIMYYDSSNKKTLFEWYVAFLKPKSHDSWMKSAIGKTGERFNSKSRFVRYMCPDSLVVDISKLDSDIKKLKKAYILPKKYHKIIDIIHERSK